MYSRRTVYHFAPTEIPDGSLARDDSGFLGISDALIPEVVLAAYSRGAFPWSSDPKVTWWSPHPRAVFDLATWKPSRTVGQSARRGKWRFSVNENFQGVMTECAASAPNRESTWISDDFIKCYSELHRRGFAHSVEVWEGHELAGGLYGLALGGFFGGESMFHRLPDASKAAFGFLVTRLRERGFVLLDGQVESDHLARLGSVAMPREKYLLALKAAVALPRSFR